MAPFTPMYLSHHDPDDYDRCAVVAGRHVCRRCLVLYPGMLVVAGFQLAGAVPSSVGIALMWLMPLGVVAEWIAEHIGGVAYSARRQVVTTALASVSFGVAFGRHLAHPFEFAATLPAVVFTVVCLAAWAAGLRRRPDVAEDWEAQFDAAEADRLDDLLARLDLDEASADAAADLREGRISPPRTRSR